MFADFIWDFDGTLFDTYPHINRALGEILEGFGVKADPEESMALLKNSIGAAVRHYMETYQLPDFWEHFDALEGRYTLAKSKPFPEILAVCREITRRGGRNFLYTHRDHIALEVLESRGPLSLFAGWVTKEDNFPSKPAPDALQAMMKRWNIPKETAVMIGDRPIDALAGRNAGITGILWDEDGRFPSYQDTPRVQTVLELKEFLLRP